MTDFTTKAKCSITIEQGDGNFTITGSIPPGTEDTATGKLTYALINSAKDFMNNVTGQDKELEHTFHQ